MNGRTKSKACLIISIFLLGLACSSVAGRTIYVDADASGANDGSSWADAYNYLQDALTDANSAFKPIEIRVAEGIYTPDSNSADPNGSGDRTATFQLINGVTIKGGHAGFGSPDPNARDIEFYGTILSGDLAGNDGPNFDNNDENSYHVVVGSWIDSTAVLDGFTIIGGNANGQGWPIYQNRGGGMYSYSGSPKVTNCAFNRNSAGSGGGMDNSNSSPTLTNCTFNKNSAFSGGGMFNEGFFHYGSYPTLTNCTFNDNSADSGGGICNRVNFYGECSPMIINCTFISNSAVVGGGMYNGGHPTSRRQSTPILTNCDFNGNAAGTGGGMYNEGFPWSENKNKLTLTNCTFNGNSAQYSGGGICGAGSSPILTNCTFKNNSAQYSGGGIYNGGHMMSEYESTPILTNCVFNKNSAGEAGGGIYSSNCSPTITDCTFSGNSSDAGGGGMYNSSGVLKLINCTFQANRADTEGGMECRTSVLTLINCTFRDNTALFGRGGMGIYDSNAILTDCAFIGNKAGCIVGGLTSIDSNVTLANCLFIENSVPWPAGMGCGGAGGISIRGGEVIVTDCIFSGNSARWGGGMVSNTDGLILTNCIFSGNFAYSDGGGMYNISQGIPTILTNCTLSGNSAVYGGGGIYHEYASSIKLANCILWNNTALNGPQVEMVNKSIVEIYHSCIGGGQAGIYDPYDGLVWGPGNIDLDPCFAVPGYWDPNGTPEDANDDFWIDGDYHLLPESPCIDAGDPNYVAEPNDTDLDGRPRVINGRIDMGAYEYNPPIPATVRIVPRTISLASKGNWIAAFLRLPEDYNVADIDPNSIFLENEIEPERFWLSEDNQIASIKFDREQVQNILSIGQIELTITGRLIDGQLFEGADVIKVTDTAGKNPLRRKTKEKPASARCGGAAVSTTREDRYRNGTPFSLYF